MCLLVWIIQMRSCAQRQDAEAEEDDHRSGKPDRHPILHWETFGEDARDNGAGKGDGRTGDPKDGSGQPSSPALC
jgi:hypothetical protein